MKNSYFTGSLVNNDSHTLDLSNSDPFSKIRIIIKHFTSVAYRGGGGVLRGSNPPSPKFQSFDKVELKFQFHGKYSCNNLIRIWVSLICKLSRTPKGLPLPHPHSLCPLSSSEFVEPPQTEFLPLPLLYSRI
jgi:hypothetical protein